MQWYIVLGSMWQGIKLIADKDEASLAALDIGADSHLFIWDGVKVRGEVVQVGEMSEPIQLLVTYPVQGKGSKEEPTETEMVMSFHKNSTLKEIRVRNDKLVLSF